MQYIAIFENARAVIRTEKACRDVGISVKVVPMPEVYSSDCGMALLFNATQLEKIEHTIKQLSIQAQIEQYD